METNSDKFKIALVITDIDIDKNGWWIVSSCKWLSNFKSSYIYDQVMMIYLIVQKRITINQSLAQNNHSLRHE